MDVCPTNTISMEPQYSPAVYLREVHVYDLALKPFEYRVIQLPPSEKVVLSKRPNEPEVKESAPTEPPPGRQG